MSARHKPFILGDTTYDLSHLDCFVFDCPTDFRDAPLTVGVRFSNHCYSCKCDDDAYAGEDLLIDHNGNRRRFDLPRYDLTVHLDGLVRGLPQAKIFQTYEERNYLHFSTQLDVAEYRIFFHLRRASAGADHDLTLFVESAYPLDGVDLVSRGRGRIRFPVLARKNYLGEAIRFDSGRNLRKR